MASVYTIITRILTRGDKTLFDISVNDQKKFLESLPEPRHDIARSFCQYKCQMLFVSIVKRLLFNSGALIAIFPTILILFILGFFTRFKYKVSAIVERSTHVGVIPDELSNKYELSSVEWEKGVSLSFTDIPFICKLFSYLFLSPYFVFKIVYKVAIYSFMRRSFHPDVIVVFNEYSFTSSALTAYCESKGIEHIDVMHGEKLYYIRDSFFRFTHAYVWEYYYEQLFLKLRAASDQFVASLPPFMRIVPEEHSDNSQYADIKYYLANYTEEELLGIISSLSQARNNGLSVKFRPHPRYSNVELLKKYISSEEIEFPTEVDILTSVSNLRYAVGVYTTVLYQAYRAGKDVVIDDINFPNNFKLLSDMQYILMNKPIEHLSSIQFQ